MAFSSTVSGKVHHLNAAHAKKAEEAIKEAHDEFVARVKSILGASVTYVIFGGSHVNSHVTAPKSDHTARIELAGTEDAV